MAISPKLSTTDVTSKLPLRSPVYESDNYRYWIELPRQPSESPEETDVRQRAKPNPNSKKPTTQNSSRKVTKYADETTEPDKNAAKRGPNDQQDQQQQQQQQQRQSVAPSSGGAGATPPTPHDESPTTSLNAVTKISGRQKSILEDHGIILGKVIGTGNYAKVKIGYSEEYKKRVAVKIISKVKAPAEYTQKFLPREIDVVKGLRHDNLIAFYQSIETSHRVYLIMQLAENGTLLDFVRERKYLDEPQARSLFKQLMSAVEYIHSKGVVHRDIKCENLLLDGNYNIKLIDFGFARKDTLTPDKQVILSKTFCGSYAYASPEILKGVAYDPFLSDIWACGVVCFAMVFGRLPYDGSNVHILLKRINASLVFPKNPQATNQCKHLILHILAPLKMRYRVQQIKEDPWMLLE